VGPERGSPTLLTGPSGRRDTPVEDEQGAHPEKDRGNDAEGTIDEEVHEERDALPAEDSDEDATDSRAESDDDEDEADNDPD